MIFTFSVFDLKYLFLGKFHRKNQNCQFKLKFGTETNLNMRNSMLIFTFFNRKYSFGEIQCKKQNCQFKLKFCKLITSNMQKSMVRLTFSVLTRNILFGQPQSHLSKLFVKEKFDTQANWNMRNPMAVFPLSRSQSGNALFSQIWFKKSKLSVYAEIWYLD